MASFIIIFLDQININLVNLLVSLVRQIFTYSNYNYLLFQMKTLRHKQTQFLYFDQYQNPNKNPYKKSLPKTQLSLKKKNIRQVKIKPESQQDYDYQLKSPKLGKLKVNKHKQTQQQGATTRYYNSNNIPSTSGLYSCSSQAHLSQKQFKHRRYFGSPMSIRQMNQLKDKMKLETEAKQAFLQLVSAGVTKDQNKYQVQQSPENLNRSKSLRQFLKAEFEEDYNVQYSEYFNTVNNQKPILKQKYSTKHQNKKSKFLNNYENDYKRTTTQFPSTFNLIQQEVVEYFGQNKFLNNFNNNYHQGETVRQSEFNNHLQDINIQSQIEQLNYVGLDSNIKQRRNQIIQQMKYDIQIQNQQQLGKSKNSILEHSLLPLQEQRLQKYSQINGILESNKHNESQSFQQHSIVQQINSQNQPTLQGILKNPIQSNVQKIKQNQSSFSSLIDPKTNQSIRQNYQSKLTQKQEFLTIQKIQQYLHILDMFATSISQFDDLLTEPGSVSGIVGFYLYKRFLKQKKKLYRCLSGGQNIFSKLDFHEITDEELRQCCNNHDCRQLVKQIGLENIQSQRNLRLVLQYLRKRLNKQFPKANLNTQQQFEIQLKYYLRFEAEQISKNVDFNNQTSKTIRFMQRLAFLYESIFVISFFNGQFVKNYELYQDIINLRAYFSEYQNQFSARIQSHSN